MSFFRKNYKGEQRKKIRVSERKLRKFARKGNKEITRARIAQTFGGTIK